MSKLFGVLFSDNSMIIFQRSWGNFAPDLAGYVVQIFPSSRFSFARLLTKGKRLFAGYIFG
jgi:hypothetical protein